MNYYKELGGVICERCGNIDVDCFAVCQNCHLKKSDSMAIRIVEKYIINQKHIKITLREFLKLSKGSVLKKDDDVLLVTGKTGNQILGSINDTNVCKYIYRDVYNWTWHKKNKRV